ncbi:MAG: hypothetical protein Q9161_003808 [Pseudevernia consocians]
MFLKPSWLSSLLFIVSATALVYPPVGLRPRYLATGTGISLPSTSPPPYPTSGANGTSVPTGSTHPTSSAQTNSPASTSTATPTPTPSSSPEFFYLVAADTGTDLDGDYVSIGADDPGLLVLYLAAAPNGVASFSTFSINADGTLQNEFSGGIASIFSGAQYGTLIFEPESVTDAGGYTKSLCEIVAGALTCQTGTDTVFSICPSEVVDGHVEGGNVDVGPTTQPGCDPLTLLVVPV